MERSESLVVNGFRRKKTFIFNCLDGKVFSIYYNPTDKLTCVANMFLRNAYSCFIGINDEWVGD